MEKMKMQTPGGAEMNLGRIAQLFPGCITETRDEQGLVKRAVDFDMLRQELSGDVVEGPVERYQLNWPGKRQAIAAANAPINKTLRPCRAESVNFDTTENLYIEADNLDALKLMQESYLGKIKMIVIDPPYNTGKDFIYKDNFTSAREGYEQESGQRNEEGGRLVANIESNGRYHSDWLSMMLPRLRLARTLLREDGVLLISINDSEQANLRKLCDEIFGEKSFIAQFVWNNEGNVDQQSKIKGVHEYIFVYCRDGDSLKRPTVIDPNIEEDSKLFNDTIENSITKNGPANPPSTVELPDGFPAHFDEGTIEPRDDKFPHILDPITVFNGRLHGRARVRSGWSSKNLFELFIKNGCTPIHDSEGKETWFELTHTGAIYNYKKRSEDQGHVLSVIRNVGTTKQNSGMLSQWGIDFSYPKPVYLIQYLASIFTSKNEKAIILDFFSGSATTAHAVLQLNAEDGGNRKFIMVQLPEPCPESSKTFKTIAEIGKERIRRAGEKIKEENATNAPNLDIGFRVLKVDSSNMKDVWYTPDQFKQHEVELFTAHIKEDRTAEDLLFQIMLDWGSPTLDAKIRTEKVGGKAVLIVNENDILACFEQGITEELVKEMAAFKPLRAIFRDDAFDDSLKINVEQIFKVLSPGTEVKSI